VGAYNITFTLIDRGLLEFVGPLGGGNLAHAFGRLLASMQTGRVYEYAMFIIAFAFLTAYAVAAASI
jgi:hypothetical protein